MEGVFMKNLIILIALLIILVIVGFLIMLIFSSSGTLSKSKPVQDGYSIGQYSGDGRISDYGVDAYPRFRIVLQQIDISAGGNREWKIVNPPTAEFTLGIILQNTSDREPLEVCNPEFDISITDVGGVGVASSKGYLKPNWECQEGPQIVEINNQLVPGPGVEYMYWTAPLCDIPFVEGGEYLISLNFSGCDDLETQISATVILEGGGVERP